MPKVESRMLWSNKLCSSFDPLRSQVRRCWPDRPLRLLRRAAGDAVLRAGTGGGRARLPRRARRPRSGATASISKRSRSRSGIDFTHRRRELDAKLEHIMPQVASMGAAVSVVDFDRDGWQDLYVTNSGEGSRNALFRNNGGRQFRGRGRTARRGGREPRRDRRLDGRGLGRLRQRRLRRPLPLQVGAARAVP